jgi:sulfonate transport system substrate-binding protein
MKDLTRRRWLTGTVGLAAATTGAALAPLTSHAAAPAVPASPVPAARLRAADVRGVQLRVSFYKGHISQFFAAAGVADFPYQVKYSEFPTASNLLIEAVSNGVIDLAGSSNVSPIFVDPAKARFRQITSLETDANSFVLVVPKGSPITSVQQLRGKQVAFLRSTTPHYFMLKALAAHGLTHRDVQAVPMMQQDGYAAFRSKRVDAWVVGGLYSSLAIRDGARVLVKGGDVMQALGVTVAGLDALSSEPKRLAVMDYLQREKQAHRWIDTHPNEWAATMQRISGVSKDIYLEQFRGRSNSTDQRPVDDGAIQAQQDIVKTFVAGGILPRPLDVRPLWDAQFNAALKA